MITVSIILLNYNGKKFNKNCIDSILVQDYQNFEIIFVDQCSTDGSLEEVKILYEKEIKNGKIKIVKNPENNGFTGGNNLGVKYADKSSKYICLLNNDTIVQKDWLEKMVQSIEKDSKLGAVSCLILNKGFEEKEKNQILNKHKKCVSTIFGESVYERMNQKEIESRFYYTTFMSGCCFLYKKDLIDNPFPQFYFAYAEDLYLSWFIINKGYKIGVNFDTYINHYGSGSFGNKPSKLKLFHGNKNQIINFLIYYPRFYKILLFPLFILKELAHLFMGVPLMRFKAKIKSRRRIIQNYATIKEMRGMVKKNKTISYYEFIHQLSFKLSDSFMVDNKLLKFLVNFGNIIFYIYGLILNIVLYIFNYIRLYLFK